MHRQLPGWRSLIKSIVGRVYANWVKSKQALPWLVTPLHTLWIWYQYFIPGIPFLWILCQFFHHLRALFTCVLNVEFMLLWFLSFWKKCSLPHWCCRQTVCLSAKGEASFPVEWIDRFVRKKRWIISAMAKGCHEVVWHRHWLSLLRSEGIVGLSWESRRETKRERSE